MGDGAACGLVREAVGAVLSGVIRCGENVELGIVELGKRGRSVAGVVVDGLRAEVAGRLALFRGIGSWWNAIRVVPFVFRSRGLIVLGDIRGREQASGAGGRARLWLSRVRHLALSEQQRAYPSTAESSTATRRVNFHKGASDSRRK